MGEIYSGEEKRTPPDPTPVRVDGFTNGANTLVMNLDRKITVAIRLLWGVLVAAVLAAFAAGVWYAKVESHITSDDIRSAATAEAVSAVSETMNAVAAEQKALRRDIQRQDAEIRDLRLRSQ